LELLTIVHVGTCTSFRSNIDGIDGIDSIDSIVSIVSIVQDMCGH
jgi:hypothetical protein